MRVSTSKQSPRSVDEILTLREDGTIAWTKDTKWKEMEILGKSLVRP